ncbi:urea transporter 1-like [Notothenia coriiceps]|uniref:Urea transporter 1-like n=1 Tax=Notothenia coriiceps TaxID=8208 RepID=A0A6I9N184_9TELE|nr:PREDICTED: urea transporter 1-like [Notothenia coriiceps]
MTAAVSKLMSVLALPAGTWSFSLSTLIFLLMSSEIRAVCRLPLSAVSHPEENRRRLKENEKSEQSRQEERRENGGTRWWWV